MGFTRTGSKEEVLTLAEFPLYARKHARLDVIHSLHLYPSLKPNGGRNPESPFAGEKTETQADGMICPKSHSK